MNRRRAELRSFGRGRVAVVTGGASGVGEALCRELAGRGAAVYAVDRAFPRGQGPALPRAALGEIVPARLDVRDLVSVRALLRWLVKHHGGLDLLINNAAVNVVGQARHLGPAQWREVLEVDLLAVAQACALTLPLMAERGGGTIVNVASLAGLLAYPTTAPYSAAKAGVIALSRALHLEGRPLGVHVAVACLGLVRTRIFHNQALALPGPCSPERYAASLPGRMISAERAARGILAGAARRRETIVFPLENRLVALLAPFGPFRRAVGRGALARLQALSPGGER